MTDISSALPGTSISKMDRLAVSRSEPPSLAPERGTGSGTGIDAGRGAVPKPLAVAIAGTLKTGDVLADVIGSSTRSPSTSEDQIRTLHGSGMVDRVMRPALVMPFVTGPWAASGSPLRQTSANPADQLAELLAALQKVTKNMNLTAFKNQSELITILSEINREVARKEASDAAQAAEKASRAASITSLIGRIVAWIVTVVSVVCAAFTGGASLVVAGIMAGLTAADQIVQASTGTSPLAKAFDSIMTPLANALGDGFAKFLEACGVPAETAKLVGQIVGTIAACVIIIVATALGARAASKFLGPVLSQLGSRIAQACSRAIPRSFEAIGQRAFSSLTGVAARMGLKAPVGADEARKFAELMKARVLRCLTITQCSLAAGTAAGNISSGVLHSQAIGAQARCEFAEMSMRTLMGLLDQVTQTFADSFSTTTRMLETACEALNETTAANKKALLGMAQAA